MLKLKKLFETSVKVSTQEKSKGKNIILKKISAGLMAGLCAFTLIGTNLGGLKTSAATTAKEPLLSGDEVINFKNEQKNL